MSSKFDPKEISFKIRRFQYEISHVFRHIWPIKFSQFRKFDVISKSVINSTKVVKSILVISLIGILVSTTMFLYGIYLFSTTPVAAEGGQIIETVENSEIITFNPVISINSEAESKVNSLIYHPLYEIEYPDFLNSTEPKPIIKPILLKSEPTWENSTDPAESFKVLNFELKEGLQWSNGEPITVDDVEYSFERIIETRGNQQFKNGFKEVKLQKTGPRTFKLVSNLQNPQLIYSANFSPISKKHYDSQITDRLISDNRSFKPTVTSGFYTFDDNDVIDPNNNSSKKVPNPIRDQQSQKIKTVVLTKNPVQNIESELKLETYIINKVDSLFDKPNITNSLVSDSKAGKTDLFTRFLGTNLTTPSWKIKQDTGLEQKTIPTNTFYNLYLNSKVGEYFINQSLRKYVICQFVNYQASPAYDGFLENIPRNKRIVPIQLNTEVEPDCPADPAEALDQNVYQITVDEQSQIKRILLDGAEIPITLLGIPESEPLLSDIRRFFLEIGLPAELITGNEEIQKALNDKDYLAAFLPVTIVSQDPYSLFGANGQNLSALRENNRILDYNIEENLLTYSLSQLTNEEAKGNIINFFQNEYVAVNLFRTNYEYNYSNRVRDLGNNLPNLYTFTDDSYGKLENWFVKSKRVKN